MNSALIELPDLELKTDIGTDGPDDTKPDRHILDLTLGIAVDHVLIARDGMAHVFKRWRPQPCRNAKPHTPC